LRRYYLIAILLGLWHTSGLAQTFPENPAHSYFSLQNYSKHQPPLYAAGFNPAAFGSLAFNSIFIYSEQRFLLSELSAYRFGTGIKTKSGVFGLQGSFEGQPDYRHVSTTLNYGRQLHERINIGLGFEYSSFHIKGYGNAGFINLSAGTILKLTDNLRSGIAIRNIPAYQVNHLSNKQNPEFSIALGYDLSENFYSALQFEKVPGHSNDIHFLVIYKARENLQIKGGLAIADPVYFGGFSFITNKIAFDIMSSYHPYLGLTPGLSIQFNLNKEPENSFNNIIQ
jgi:hypothetical protein